MQRSAARYMVLSTAVWQQELDFCAALCTTSCKVESHVLEAFSATASALEMFEFEIYQLLL